MMLPAPITYTWDGTAMVPLPGLARRCDKQFVVGERYTLEVWQDRSQTSHNHEFAWLAEAWRNLPGALTDSFPTTEHLRKRALIQAGYFTEEMIDAGSKAAALRVAAFARGMDEFAYVITRGPLVVVRRAKSQSRRAMGSKEFQESKSKIMEIVAGMIGVSTDTLQRNAGMAA